LKREQPLLDTEDEGSAQMVINLQRKKPLSPQKKWKKKLLSDSSRIDKSTWNPFEKVNPEILERSHKKGLEEGSIRQYLFLTNFGHDQHEEDEEE
jgi:hypothetical protein